MCVELEEYSILPPTLIREWSSLRLRLRQCIFHIQLWWEPLIWFKVYWFWSCILTCYYWVNYLKPRMVWLAVCLSVCISVCLSVSLSVCHLCAITQGIYVNEVPWCYLIYKQLIITLLVIHVVQCTTKFIPSHIICTYLYHTTTQPIIITAVYN